MIRRVALALAAILILPLIAIPLWIAAHRADLAAPDDADLSVQHRDVPSDQNALRVVQAAAELFEWPVGDEADDILQAIYEGESWDPAWVEDRIRRTAPALAALERGLSGPELHFPERSMDEVAFEPWMALSHLMKLTAADAYLLLERGQPERAVERSLAGMRFAKRISEASGVTLMDLMFARASQTIGLVALERVVRQTPLTAEMARSLSRRVESLRVAPNSWRRMWALEYQSNKEWLIDMDIEVHSREMISVLSDTDVKNVSDLLAVMLPVDFLWQPNRTLARYANHYRKLQAASASPCMEAAHDERRDIKTLIVLLDGNPIGDVLADISLGHHARFESRRCHSSTWISLVNTGIATKAYWDLHARLPESLEDLVSEYLDRVPLDGFGGEPIRYSRERRMAWSIGEDLVDAGGSAQRTPRDTSEPTLLLDF